MSSNIEDFLIRFKFADREAVQGFKSIAKAMDNLETKQGKLSRKQKSTTKQDLIDKGKQVNKLSQLNTLEARRLSLKKKIAEADKLGVGGLQKYRGSLAIKDPEKVRAKQIQLDEEIFRKRQELNRMDSAAKQELARKDAAKRLAQEERLQKEMARKRVQAQKQADIKLQSQLAGARGNARKKLDQAQFLGAGNAFQVQNLKRVVDTEDIDAIRKYSRHLESLNYNLRQKKRIEDELARVQANSNYQTLAGSRSMQAKRQAAMYLNRAQELLRANTAASTREYIALKRSLAGAAAQYRRTAREALGLHNVQRGLTNSTRNMIQAYASVFLVMQGVTSINRVGQQFEAMDSAMLAAFGTQEKAAEQIQFLERLSTRLGISVLETSNAFAKLSFSAKDDMSVEDIQGLFTGLTEFGRVMGVDNERMKWSVMAIQQINGLPSEVIRMAYR